MAKRNSRHPALRGYQVARWIARGILKAAQLGETPILIVREAARVRLTRRFRTTISQGILLVPRWIPAPAADLERWHTLSVAERREKGLILGRGMDLLLIYQQVEDLFHLQRQQYHVLWDREQTVFFESVIRPHIVRRAIAADRLIRQRAAQLKHVGESSLPPILEALGNFRLLTPKMEAGILRYLDGLIAGLDECTERPFVTRRKRAQRSLRRAQHWIREGEFARAAKMVRSAQRNLNR